MRPEEMEKRLRAALAEPVQAMHEAVELLAVSRPMDPSGAALVLERESCLGGLLAGGPEAAAELAGFLTDLAQARRCLGCGTCCLTSSPTLYAEDLDRLGPESISRQALYALRPGEKVSSAREGATRLLERELIKLRERQTGGQASGRGCLFLEAGRCGIYEARPLQCRVLECWSGSHAGELAGRPRLSRAMLFSGDQTALALISEYDHKLPAGELTQSLEQAARGDAGAGATALAILEMDHNLRQGVSRRYGYAAEDLDLMWGRPAVSIARSHGLEPAMEGRDRVVLRKTKA